jgi:hypothetical protein
MKPYIFSLITIGLIVVSSCNKDERETPTCIWNKITAFDSSFECAEAKVDKYTFQGETVYVFDPGVCSQADMASEVLNQDCESIGYLGGLIGNQIINGENFSSAHFEETIWTK